MIPSDANFAAYYDQAISKGAQTRPPPAVGGVPVQHCRPEPVAPGLGPADRAADADLSGHGGQDRAERLPPAPSGTLNFPSNAQYTKAENLVAQEWSKEVLG